MQRFAEPGRNACINYEIFVADGIAAGKRPDLIGGGLIRSSGGWQEVVWAHRLGSFLKSDERILGDSDFVEEVLEAAEELEVNSCYSGITLEEVKNRVTEVLDIDVELVTHRGKHPVVVQAKSLLCYWATHELGITETALAEKLGMCQSAISRAAARGEQLAVRAVLRLR